LQKPGGGRSGSGVVLNNAAGALTGGSTTGTHSLYLGASAKMLET
jgi:hypothetical protein